MFSNLMNRVFGKSQDKPAEESAPTPSPVVEETVEEVAIEAAIVEETSPVEDAPTGEPAPTPISIIDVEANLAAMAKENSEDLDWKKSIVDLLKLVGMDSSLSARKELARELGYSEEDIESKGSAEMNMWLHKQVMKRLAENGGTVPADLLD